MHGHRTLQIIALTKQNSKYLFGPFSSCVMCASSFSLFCPSLSYEHRKFFGHKSIHIQMRYTESTIEIFQWNKGAHVNTITMLIRKTN